jgi:hypothetical protein
MFGRKKPSDVIKAAAIQAAAQVVLFSASRREEGEITADQLSKVVALGAVELLKEFEKRMHDQQ